MTIEINDTAKTLLLLLFGIWFTEIHTIIPDSDPKDYWLFYDPPSVDYGITRKTFVYFLSQHIFLMSLISVFIYESTKLRDFFKWVLVLEFFDMLDYLLFYHYTIFPGYDIKYTYFKIPAYSLLIVNFIWKQRKSF